MPRTTGRCPSPEATGRLRHGLTDRGARAGFPTALETVPSCFVTSPRSTPGIRRVPRSDSAAPTAADAARQVAFLPPDNPGAALPRSRSSRKRRSLHAVQRAGHAPEPPLARAPSRSAPRSRGPIPISVMGSVPVADCPNSGLRRFGGGAAAATPAPRRAPRRVPHLTVGGSAPAMAADILTRIAPPRRNSRPPLTFIADRVSHNRGPQRGLLVTALRDAAPAPRPRTNGLRCSSSA